MKKQRVFVYGTLKSGMYFHDAYLGGDKSNFVGPAVTTKDYTLYVRGLPFMVRETSDTGVKGELYEVDESVLASLDELEGHPIFYKRDIIEVNDKDGKKVLAWGYLYPKFFKGKEYAHTEEEFT